MRTLTPLSADWCNCMRRGHTAFCGCYQVIFKARCEPLVWAFWRVFNEVLRVADWYDAEIGSK